MNLYDKDDGFRCFTLREANELLPEVIRVTETAVRELEVLENVTDSEQALDPEQAKSRLESESADILQRWTQEIMDLGVYPKGYFTVDFKSPIPDLLFCWTYGEEEISHTHKVYESFKDRVPIKDDSALGFEQSLN